MHLQGRRWRDRRAGSEFGVSAAPHGRPPRAVPPAPGAAHPPPGAGRWLVGLALGLAFAAGPAAAGVPPWSRTEAREPCASFDPLRRPLFGDLHVHTAFSHDAYIRATRVTPADAYAFARGQAVLLPDETGSLARAVQLSRPLDFTAVTDHAEFFGEVRVCTTPGTPVEGDDLCVRMRELGGDPARLEQNNAFWSFSLGGLGEIPDDQPFCSVPGVDCAAAAASVWQEVQAAAEGAYDRTAACSFTTFVGYEHTPAPLGAHLHRNVIFRNERVPARAVSYLETEQQGAAQPLWSALEQECLADVPGCEFLTIPHNSNLSGGLRWPDPPDAADARRRQEREPLVEIYQHKGSSECRFDRLAGAGVGGADELCTFEQDPRARQGPFPRPDIASYPRRNLVRTTLEDGLLFDQLLGVNPFRLGFVGGTDTHSGTPGATDERSFQGHRGALDGSDARRLATVGFGTEQIRFSPGGLTAVFAEENSRDAIYEALRRRETYATSGTRPVVRFFAGRLDRIDCGDPDFVAEGYAGGVPMGATLGPVRGRRSPRFAVLAQKDPGDGSVPGTDLQRIQIVKGYLDENGRIRERVFDVAGDADSGATVDPATCEPVGSGFPELCAVFEDPDFDPDQRAFYYARVLENPTCRWSTRACRAAGVDPFASDCEAQAAAAGPPFDACCLGPDTDPFFEPVIQERAWTSPIWYRPEATSRLRVRIARSGAGGRDRLRLSLRLGRAPAGLDPGASPLSVRISDDDAIYAAALPAGSLAPRGARIHELRDRTGTTAGIRLARVRRTARGELALDLVAREIDLSAADPGDHLVRVEVSLGELAVEEFRLLRDTGRGLRGDG